jgi:hypothetical protein
MLILVASVGGSVAPIASAIAAKRPDHVLFVASEPRGDRPGSAGEVPSILQKAQRPKQAHDILRLEDPDDPEAAFLALRGEVERLRGKHPSACFLFDYTGGTKSMTSAVFQCALATPGAELQLMTGRREDLQGVTPRTERPVEIRVGWLLAERQEARLREAWRRFDYAAAAAGFRHLDEDLGSDEKAPEELRRRYADLAEISEAFDLWDRFRHKAAAERLQGLVRRRPAVAAWARRAQACAADEAARILDLWRNAERCAARGRYDDAVARLYRLTEWIVQWRLKARHGLDAGKMDWSRVPSKVVAAAGLREQVGKTTLSGCEQAWKLVAALEPQGVVVGFLSSRFPHTEPKTGEGWLRDMLKLRNRSILAHGETPLAESDWEEWHKFAEAMRTRVFVPLLRDAGKAADLPPQLPEDPAKLGL